MEADHLATAVMALTATVYLGLLGKLIASEQTHALIMASSVVVLLSLAFVMTLAS